MSDREYVIGTNPEGFPTITLNQDEETIPFNVWRDVARLAWKSHSRGVGNLTFVFATPVRIPRAVEVLKGGMWREKDANKSTDSSLPG